MFTCDLQVWTQNLDQDLAMDLAMDLMTVVKSSHSINTARRCISFEVTRSSQWVSGWFNSFEQFWLKVSLCHHPLPSSPWLKCLDYLAQLLDCLVCLLSPHCLVWLLPSVVSLTARLNRFESNEHARQSCQWARWLQVAKQKKCR